MGTECLLENTGDRIGIFGTELADALKVKLEGLSPPKKNHRPAQTPSITITTITTGGSSSNLPTTPCDWGFHRRLRWRG